MAISRAVEGLGLPWDLRFADDGRELLAMVADSSAGSPDLIVADLQMPGLDGFGLLEELKTKPEWAKIPVLVLTTSRYGKDVDRAYSLGCAAFFEKPDSISGYHDLLQTVARYWDMAVRPQYWNN